MRRIPVSLTRNKMTTAERKEIKAARLARYLAQGNIPECRSIVPLDYSVIFAASQMVRSVIIDDAKRDEFTRTTAKSLLKLAAENYFPE